MVVDLIGFGFKKRTGKDYACSYLARRLWENGSSSSARILSFADPLKHIAHTLYSWAGVYSADWYKDRGDLPEDRETVLPKIGMTYRELLIKLGTKAIRENVFEDTWLEIMREKIAVNRELGFTSLISDVRFLNELRLIQSLGGIAIHVERPDLTPTKDVADCALDGHELCFDHTITANTGELDLLEEQLESIIKMYDLVENV